MIIVTFCTALFEFQFCVPTIVLTKLQLMCSVRSSTLSINRSLTGFSIDLVCKLMMMQLSNYKLIVLLIVLLM